MVPSFRKTTISIPERHGNEQNSYRFVRSILVQVVVSMHARCEVRSSRAVHGDSDSGWACLGIERQSTLSNGLQLEGAARIITGRPFSEIVAIVQSKCVGCQNPLESEDLPHIARNEFT